MSNFLDMSGMISFLTLIRFYFIKATPFNYTLDKGVKNKHKLDNSNFSTPKWQSTMSCNLLQLSVPKAFHKSVLEWFSCTDNHILAKNILSYLDLDIFKV